MFSDELLMQVRRLTRPSTLDVKRALLHKLRQYPTETDRFRTNKWKGRGHTYFHSLQDLLFANEVMSARLPGYEFIRECQSCFIKDLECYLSVFPQSEEGKIREIFEVVLNTGASAYWEEDGELVKQLYPLYKDLDRKVICPWIERSKEKIFLEA